MLSNVSIIYSHRRAKIKGSLDLFNILKGIRQCGLISPALSNSSVSAAQCSVECICIYDGIEASLFIYADYILNLSHTFLGSKRTFFKTPASMV